MVTQTHHFIVLKPGIARLIVHLQERLIQHFPEVGSNYLYLLSYNYYSNRNTTKGSFGTLYFLE